MRRIALFPSLAPNYSRVANVLNKLKVLAISRKLIDAVLFKATAIFAFLLYRSRTSGTERGYCSVKKASCFVFLLLDFE